MRIFCAMTLSVALLAAGTLSIANAEARSVVYDLDIPSENLTAALQSFAIASHHKLLYKAELTSGKISAALKGQFTAEQAMERLLAGTRLTYQITEGAVVLIKRQGDKTELLAPGAAAYPQPSSREDEKEGKANPSEGFRVAQLDQGANSPPATVRTNVVGDGPDRAQLEEIVVTAQKRAERIQDVPVPLTSLDARTLANNNQLRLQDYFSSVPGFNVTPTVGLGSQQLLTIRGITTGGGNPSVGITLDDAPYGSSTLLGGGGVVPDIDPSDLDHIEVLRGPQGTLYGASSMGGLVKFVTVEPSTDSVSARVQAGTSSVYNGEELGYNVRGAINVPLSDVFAVRASAFARQDPGYIDNPVLHSDGINKNDVYGVHLSGLWKPSEVFSIKLSALYQDIEGDGSSDVNLPTAGQPQTAGLGDLQQNYIRGVGKNDRKVQAYSATVNARLGGADFTAVTGFNVNSFSDMFDYTYLLAQSTQSLFGVTGTPLTYENTTHKFTEEVRLSVPIAEKLDWLVGGFYTHEKSVYNETLSAENTDTGQIVGQWLFETIPSTYSEYAAFTDLTYHFTERFDVQLGGRQSHISQSFGQEEIGPFAGPTPVVNPTVNTAANVFTYLVTPRLKISQDLMLYLRLASGYRAGGPNSTPGTPRQFYPDKTKNYEIGVKGDVLDHVVSFDASLYYIDWNNIQLTLVNPQTGGYQANGGGAKSQGVELSAQARPLQHLTVAGWVAWNDAELTTSFPLPPLSATYGVSGDRLPYSSRFSANLSAEQTFPLTRRATGFVGAALSYVGNRLDVFTSTPQRQDLPAYTKADARAGVKYDLWTGNLFVTNAFDRRGLVSGGLGNFPPFGVLYIQPRTVGLSLTREF